MPGITVSVTGAQNDSRFGMIQYPLKSYILKQAEAFEQESLLEDLFRMERSENWGESYSGDTAMSDFEPVGEGGTYPKTGFQEGFRRVIENETWKQSFSVTQEAIEDNKIGSIKTDANKLVTAYYRTREKFGRAVYLGGISATSVPYGSRRFACNSADGLSLFNTQHPAKVKGKKQSNLFADEFSVTALDKLETNMQNTLSDNGELLAIAPDTIWIGNDATLKRKVFEAVGSEKDPESSKNGMNYQIGRWTILVDPYLNHVAAQLGLSTLPWFLLDSKFSKINNGAIFQDRVKLRVNSHIDTNNDNNVWNGRARFSAGFVDWRFIAAGGVSGGSNL